jgi:hypothetical protein
MSFEHDLEGILNQLEHSYEQLHLEKSYIFCESSPSAALVCTSLVGSHPIKSFSWTWSGWLLQIAASSLLGVASSSSPPLPLPLFPVRLLPAPLVLLLVLLFGGPQHTLSQHALQHTLSQHTLQHTLLQHALQHTLQHAVQHTRQHTLQHALQHTQQHTLQHTLQRTLSGCSRGPKSRYLERQGAGALCYQ